MREQDIQTAIMVELGMHPLVAWAHVTTVGRFQLCGRGRSNVWITCGFEGLADILGQMRDGRILAIEVKKPGKAPEEKQVEFLDMVQRNGGVCGVAHNVAEALDIVEGRV